MFTWDKVHQFRVNCSRESFLDLNLSLESRKIKGNRLLLLNIHETLRKRAYVLLMGGGGRNNGGFQLFKSPFGSGKLSFALCTRETKFYLSGAILLAWLQRCEIIPLESNVANGRLPLNRALNLASAHNGSSGRY